MAHADGSLMQTDDIHSVGTSWLVHVVYAANKLAALHLNGWLAFTRAFAVHLQSFSETLHLPQLHLHRSATGYYIYYNLEVWGSLKVENKLLYVKGE